MGPILQPNSFAVQLDFHHPLAQGCHPAEVLRIATYQPCCNPGRPCLVPFRQLYTNRRTLIEMQQPNRVVILAALASIPSVNDALTGGC